MKTTLDNESLLDIRAKYPDLFYTQGWYENESFAKEKFSGTWEVDLEPVKDSFDKTWQEQQECVIKGTGIPPAAVLAAAICEHFKETGTRAFERVHVRTSSVDSSGNRVVLGKFDAKGLFVYDFWDSGRSSSLGLASSRKVEAGNLEPLEDLGFELPHEITINNVIYRRI